MWPPVDVNTTQYTGQLWVGVRVFFCVCGDALLPCRCRPPPLPPCSTVYEQANKPGSVLPQARMVASVLLAHCALNTTRPGLVCEGQSRREVSLPAQFTSASATGRLSGNTCMHQNIYADAGG